ncbi:MAG TPA: DUF4058 family protein [Isosphaeraceae bacterium]
MANPFPGIDPYVEAQHYWEDFHTRFLTYTCDAINDRLPEGYDAKVEERFTIASFRDEPGVWPDVAVLRRESGPQGGGAAPASAVAEPVVLPLPVLIAEEITQRWIEVRRREDRSVVAVIELLSPANKVGHGRLEYVTKRRLLIDEPIHLIELDFLLGSRRLPMGRSLPPGDFCALVASADRRMDCDVYAWTIRQPLPTIPLPLDQPIPDVPIDLASLYATAFERGRYDRNLRRDRPLDLPLAPDDLAWASTLGA